MSKSIARGLVGAGAILLAILLAGCTGEPEPTPVSLDEYLTLCATTEQELADDATFGDFSSLFAAEADGLEALTPPAQLSEWHLLNIEGFRTIQAFVDSQPEDDVIDFGSFLLMAAASADSEEKLREAAARLPEDVRQQMIEADCIDLEDVSDDFEDMPDDFEDAPDDHGNDINDATVVAVGADVEGALGYQGDSDYFRFNAEEGQLYQINVALGSLSDSTLWLRGPDGSQLAYNDDNGDSPASRIFWEAPASGDYYLEVRSYGRGSYTLTVSHSTVVDDHGNDMDDATVAAVGADVEGAIDYLGDSDYFRFTAEEGQFYQIDVALGSLPDSELGLLGPNGRELAYNDDNGDSPASRIFWEAPASGDYYLEVRSYGRGSYTLTVSHSTIVDDYGNDIDDATVTRMPEEVAGAITPEPTPVSLDEYLTLCATTELELADDATFGDLSSDLAAEEDRFEALTPPAQLSEWHLLNIEGFRTIQAFIELQPKDDVIDFARFFLMAAISADSEEKLRAAAVRLREDVRQQMIEAGCIDPEDVLDDHEDVPDDHGNDIDDATAIRAGADVRGAMDYDGDIDFFRFQAERGQSYQIDVALGTLDDSIVDLYDADGSFLDSNDDYETFASRLYWEAPSSVERYVAVEGYGTGTYTLTVSLVIDDHGNSEGDATAIRVGTEVRGAVDYDGDIDYFRFQAERGQSYQIDVALGTLNDSIVYLYDGDGWFMLTNDDEEYWETPSSGERYVTVEGYGTGTYTLTVSLVDDHGNDFESATRLVVGEAVSLELENEDDTDVFVFRARSGAEYVLSPYWEYYSFRESYTERPLLTVYSANGQEHTRLMGYDFHENGVRSIDLGWQALSGGNYYIVIGDGNTVGAGAIILRNRAVSNSTIVDDHGDDIDDATVAAVGADVEGVIGYLGDSDYFRFIAERGQLYQIDVALGSLPDSVLMLLAPAGWQLAYNDDHGDSLASRIFWEAPESGVYYLEVLGYGVGSYTLTVSQSTIVDDHGDDIDDATVAAVAADVEGLIDYQGDSDYFRFSAVADRLYQIDVNLGTLGNSVLILLAPDGWELAYNDDHGDSLASRIFWEAPASGDYYLVVEAYAWSTQLGSYTLTVTPR